MAAFLHVVPDDKFIDDAIIFFSDLGGSHRWISVNSEKKLGFSFVKNEIVGLLSLTEAEIEVGKGQYDAIVFHSLYVEVYSLVLRVPNSKIVIWNSWGADIYYATGYYPSLIELDLYKRLTQKNLVVEKIPLQKRIKRIVKDVIHPSRIRDRKNHAKWVIEETKRCVDTQQKVISRIDLCATVLKQEYIELTRLPRFRASYYPFKYVSKEQVHNGSYNFEGDCVLVGNSRDSSNNHLDILRLLDKKGIKNKRIVPLSYGMMKTAEVLKEKYGRVDKVELLIDFLDRPTYWEKVRSCKAAVFGHIRQQALGNINQCLLQGSKVFLYKDSMVYKYYREEGIVVFTIDDDLNQKSIDEKLPSAVVNENRKIIEDLWGYEKVLSRVKEALASKGL